MNSNRIWLAMSGGGFRAALFHLGCLKRLYELNILERVYGFSATSGGALIAALYADSISQGQKFEEFEARLLSVASQGLLTLPLMVFCATRIEIAGLLFLSTFLLNSEWSWILFTGAALAGIGGFLHLLALTQVSKLFHNKVPNERSIKTTWGNRTRIFKMLLSPAQCRWELFSLQLFQDRTHNDLELTPQIHLAAVDLNQGEQFVFSNRCGALLNVTGSRRLWEQSMSQFDSDDSAVRIGELRIGYSVAASSAFPPIFKPIPMSINNVPIGVFWDGGLVDNHAVETLRALALHTSAAVSNEYNPDYEYAKVGFQEVISSILIMDGSGAHTIHKKFSWSRLRGFFRVMDVILNQQKHVANATPRHVNREFNIPCCLIGLQSGLTTECEIYDQILSDSLENIRTHFDAFSKEEMALLVYAGYTWIDYRRVRKTLGIEPENIEQNPPLGFQEILPELYRPYDNTVPKLRRHMSTSGGRIGIWRKFKRWTGELRKIEQ